MVGEHLRAIMQRLIIKGLHGGRNLDFRFSVTDGPGLPRMRLVTDMLRRSERTAFTLRSELSEPHAEERQRCTEDAR